MEVSRESDGSALVRLAGDEVRDLLGAFALSMAAYGILQNFMTPPQRAMTIPSIVFISRLGGLLADGEQFMDGEADQPPLPAAPDQP